MTPAQRATANLLSTYLALGRAFPGAEVRETPAYTTLLSDLPHPSGNFAARFALDPWSAAELRDLALTRPAFQAVALSEDGPAHLPELLRRAGFKPVQRLVSMVWEPPSWRSSPDHCIPWVGRRNGLETIATREALIAEDRRRAGRFMADAFFAREPEILRDAMAEAFVGAGGLSVHTYSLRDKFAAAVTLTRGEGILGVYNLCVAPAHRDKGLGSSLVAWCLAQAERESLPACLQCSFALEPWYARQGFVSVGAVVAWRLQDGRRWRPLPGPKSL